MANDCNNFAMVTHSDINMMNRFIEDFKNNCMYSGFDEYPLGSQPEHSEADRLVFALANQRWDKDEWKEKMFGQGERISRYGFYEGSLTVKNIDGQLTAFLNYCTRWAPSGAAFECWVDNGFDVEVFYEEPGTQLYGRYKNGNDDRWKTDTGKQYLLDKIVATISPALVEVMGLYEYYTEMIEWEKAADEEAREDDEAYKAAAKATYEWDEQLIG